jgi:hypothetical protein
MRLRLNTAQQIFFFHSIHWALQLYVAGLRSEPDAPAVTSLVLLSAPLFAPLLAPPIEALRQLLLEAPPPSPPLSAGPTNLSKLKPTWARFRDRLVNGRPISLEDELLLLACGAVAPLELDRSWYNTPRSRQGFIHGLQGRLGRATIAEEKLRLLRGHLGQSKSLFQIEKKLGDETVEGLGFERGLVPLAKSRVSAKLLPYLKQIHHEVSAMPQPYLRAELGPLSCLGIVPSFMHVLHSVGKNGLDIENRMELGQGVERTGPLSEFKKDLSKRQAALIGTDVGAAHAQKQDHVTQAVNCGKVRLIYEHSPTLHAGIMGWRGQLFSRAMRINFSIPYSSDDWSKERNVTLFVLPFLGWNLHQRNDAEAAAKEKAERKPAVRQNHWHMFVKEWPLFYAKEKRCLKPLLEEDGSFSSRC